MQLSCTLTYYVLKYVICKYIQVPQHEAKFDVLVNDEWSKRHMVTKKFVQAARKVNELIHLQLLLFTTNNGVLV